MSQESVPPLPKSRSGANGCLIGCLVAFVVSVLVITLIVYFAYRATSGAINEMTEPAPRELPVVDATAEERQAANEKFEQFRGALENGGEQKEYSFTGEEVNILLRSSQAIPFGDSVYVTIADGEIHGEVSLNLGDLIPIGLLEGRYANGSATFNVYTQDDRLFIFVEDFQLKGEDAESEMITQLRQQNLAQDMANDPKVQEWMAKIDTIEVVDDRLVVTLK